MKRAFKIVAWTILAAGVIMLAGLIAFSAILWDQDRSRPDADIVEREAKAKLPMGSSRAQVEAYLDAHHFRHSFDVESSQEVAFVGPVRGSGIVLRELSLHFRFAPTGGLLAIQSDIALTGP